MPDVASKMRWQAGFGPLFLLFLSRTNRVCSARSYHRCGLWGGLYCFFIRRWLRFSVQNWGGGYAALRLTGVALVRDKMAMGGRVCLGRVVSLEMHGTAMYCHSPLMRTVAEMPGTKGAQQRLHMRRLTDGSLCSAVIMSEARATADQCIKKRVHSRMDEEGVAHPRTFSRSSFAPRSSSSPRSSSTTPQSSPRVVSSFFATFEDVMERSLLVC